MRCSESFSQLASTRKSKPKLSVFDLQWVSSKPDPRLEIPKLRNSSFAPSSWSHGSGVSHGIWIAVRRSTGMLSVGPYQHRNVS